MSYLINIAVNIAVSATRAGMCSISFSRTCRRSYGIGIIMSKSSLKFCSANGTFLSIGTVCIFTKCVSGCSNNSLRYNGLAAYSTVRAFGKSGLGTVRSYCCISYSGMSGCVNNSLRYNNLATDSAMRALGKSGLITFRSYCRINYLGVSELVGFIRNVVVTANRTSVSGISTGCTSRISYYCIIAVRKSINLISNIAVTTSRASVGRISL